MGNYEGKDHVAMEIVEKEGMKPPGKDELDDPGDDSTGVGNVVSPPPYHLPDLPAHEPHLLTSLPPELLELVDLVRKLGGKKIGW